MIRALILALALALGVLTGCGGPGSLIDTEPLPVAQSLPPLAQTAQRAINEANGWIAAMATVIHQDAKAGLVTRDQELAYQADFRGYRKKLDEMQGLVDDCVATPASCNLIGDAEQRAKLVSTGLQALRKSLAERRAR